MQAYEYKVIPAPRRGKSAKGVRGGEAKFAHALNDLMNTWGAEGWEYLRAETLPAEERSGLTSRTTVYHNMLVFRRALAPESEPIIKPEPVLALPEPASEPAPALEGDGLLEETRAGSDEAPRPGL